MTAALRSVSALPFGDGSGAVVGLRVLVKRRPPRFASYGVSAARIYELADREWRTATSGSVAGAP
jgi:hypothetical protein